MCEIPNRSIGSGLTRRQRSLVIIIMILFCYICFGALVISLLLKLSFINSIYFTLTSIETIGFGDIVPKTTGARVFVCIYVTFGVLTIGVAIGMIRETVLEAMEVAYRRRTRKVMERWKDSRKRRRVVAQWKRGAADPQVRPPLCSLLKLFVPAAALLCPFGPPSQPAS